MQNQKLEQNQKLRFGPKQIHFLNLLQTPLSLLNDRIEKEIEDEEQKAQIEIKNLKKNSINNIAKISEEIAQKIMRRFSN